MTIRTLFFLAFAFGLTNSLFAQCETLKSFPGGEEEGVDNMSLYRGYHKEGNIEKAYEHWEKIYNHAPGESERTYVDGVTFASYFMDNTEDQAEITKWEDLILEVNQNRRNCYCSNSKKEYAEEKCDLKEAYDRYYYVYRDTKGIYDMFKKGFSAGYEGITFHYIEPYLELTTTLLSERAITGDDALASKEAIYLALDNQDKKNAGDAESLAPYKQLRATADENFKALEMILYGSDHFASIAKANYEASAKDKAARIAAKQYLERKGAKSTPFYGEVTGLIASLDAVKKQTTAAASKVPSRVDLSGTPQEKLASLEAGITDLPASVQASRYYNMAAINLGELKNYSQAVRFARTAIEKDPSYAKAYILIGQSYIAGRGSCGKGFDERMVISAAIDNFYKAKSVSTDASVKTDAQNKINKYSANLPTKTAVFERGLKVGDSYNVGCWIGANTTIRTSK